MNVNKSSNNFLKLKSDIMDKDFIPTSSPPRLHENKSFKQFIIKLLNISGLGDKDIAHFTRKEFMIEFTKAFTSKDYDEIYNYEFYEILGDATSNKIVVWYFKRRFPEVFDMNNSLYNKKGHMGAVAIMARLKINGVSKQTYSEYARNLGFFEFIRATPTELKSSRKILEDVFEAFLGCLESIIDDTVSIHSGYGIAYNFMESLMDKQNISLKEEDLYDSITRLNEINFELKKRDIKVEINVITDKNKLSVENSNPETYSFPFTAKLIIKCENINRYRGTKLFERISKMNTKFKTHSGPTKKDARQMAAKYFFKNNYFEYLKQITTINPSYILKTSPIKNTLISPTKYNTKSPTKYYIRSPTKSSPTKSTVRSPTKSPIKSPTKSPTKPTIRSPIKPFRF